MKNFFKNFMTLALTGMLVFGITACNNQLDPDNISEAKKDNVIFADGDFNLAVAYSNIGTYESSGGVTGTIKNQWGGQEERTAVLLKNWFNNEKAPSKSNIKSISFVKNYTGTFTRTWSGGENITVYYKFGLFGGSIVVSAGDLTIFAPEDCTYLFGGFTSVESIDLTNFDTSDVTDMKSMFYDCKKLRTLRLNNFNTSNVTDMSYMFLRCNTLKHLDLRSFDTSRVTAATDMFRWDNNLQVTYTPATWTIGTDWSGVTFLK